MRTITMQRALTFGVTAASALLLAAPAALGATATLSGDTITYNAAPGEENGLSISQSGGNVVLNENGTVIITDGGGCPVTGGDAQCPEAGVTKIVVNLDDRDDGLNASSGSITSAIIATGGAGNDSLNGSAQADTLDGGAGTDSLFGGLGNDVMSGGSGSDSIPGSPGDDVQNGGPGNDGLQGGDGNDTLNGEDGDDGLRGDAGNDTLNGGAGDDDLDADEGADVLSGGPGRDRADHGSRSVDQNLSTDGVANDGAAGEGDNIGTDVESLRGGGGNDTITGGPAANYLQGDDGDDTLSGGDGPDEIEGDSGNDVLNGDAGGDRLYSDSGDDTANGGADGDVLYAGRGSDVLNGGDGSDRFQPDSGDGPDTFNGGAGNDTVSWEYYDQSVIVTIDGLANDGIAGANDNVAADVEGVIGGLADDILSGGTAANVIEGGPGSDTITIRDAGADTATCGTGRDAVIADALDSVDPIGAGCESVDRGSAPGTGRVMGRIGGVSHKRGVVKLTLTCPLDALVGCSGSGKLTSAGLGTVGSVAFMIPSSSAQTITIRLSKKAKSKLNRSKRLKVKLELAGNDLRGPLVASTLTFTLKR
jgi:Ca2+-binding RTX toxin-like protein